MTVNDSRGKAIGEVTGNEGRRVINITRSLTEHGNPPMIHEVDGYTWGYVEVTTTIYTRGKNGV